MGVQYPPPLPTTEFEMQGILEKLVGGGEIHDKSCEI